MSGPHSDDPDHHRMDDDGAPPPGAAARVRPGERLCEVAAALGPEGASLRDHRWPWRLERPDRRRPIAD